MKRKYYRKAYSIPTFRCDFTEFSKQIWSRDMQIKLDTEGRVGFTVGYFGYKGVWIMDYGILGFRFDVGGSPWTRYLITCLEDSIRK